jgi:hypothetical protein
MNREIIQNPLDEENSFTISQDSILQSSESNSESLCSNSLSSSCNSQFSDSNNNNQFSNKSFLYPNSFNNSINPTVICSNSIISSSSTINCSKATVHTPQLFHEEQESTFNSGHGIGANAYTTRGSTSRESLETHEDQQHIDSVWVRYNDSLDILDGLIRRIEERVDGNSAEHSGALGNQETQMNNDLIPSFLRRSKRSIRQPLRFQSEPDNTLGPRGSRSTSNSSNIRVSTFSEMSNTEQGLMYSVPHYVESDEHYCGKPDLICRHCAALYFEGELNSSKQFTKCCQGGTSVVEPIPPPLPLIRDLLLRLHPLSILFVPLFTVRGLRDSHSTD